MAKIYSSFSNPSGDLSQLQREFEGLFNFFNSNAIKKKVDYEFGMNATVDALTSKIIAGQKDIRLFHFSGHSGGSGLDFPKSQFTSEQISRFFNTICSDQSKIDCVFLNGCENEDIVNQLTGVPVVIGTRSKIEDHLASKFTLDFFNALIKSECSYQQAFKDAESAIVPTTDSGDRLRGEGGSDEIENHGRLGEYFFKANDKKVAESKFPLKPKKKNWTKYLFLLFMLVVLFLAFLFKGPILKLISGHTCPNVKNEINKCSFVIGDFTTDQNLDFNLWIYNELEKSTLNKYFNYIYIENFRDFIINNSIHRDSLPARCNYDFNLTGSYFSNDDSLRAEFNISPVKNKPVSLESFPYSIKSLDALGTLITQLHTEKPNPFVLYEMCIQCALKKNLPKIDSALTIFAKQLDAERGTALYQRFYYDVSYVFLKNGDTTSAHLALDEVRHSTPNDFALMATERKIELYSSSNNILRVLQTQSELINEYDDRIQAPSKYKLNFNSTQYEKGENNVRLDRARLIFKYKDGILKEYRDMALNDFEYLQKINFPPGDFSTEIKELSHSPSPQENQFHLFGYIYTENGNPLAKASVIMGETKIFTDNNGLFDFGLFPYKDMVGGVLSISASGYQARKVSIIGEVLDKIILSANIPESQRIIFQAIQTNKELYDKIYLNLQKAGYEINKNYSKNIDTIPVYFPKTSSVIYHNASSENQATLLARQLREWTNENFELRFLPSKKSIQSNTSSGNDDLTIQFVGTMKMFQLYGSVFAKGDKPLYGAIVEFNGEKIKTNESGVFDFGVKPAAQVMGMPLNISRDKFTSVTIKINEENIRKIVLEPFKGVILNDHKILKQQKN